ncbi:hypothetical protein Pmar_PMAR005153 [Perkinsus marinus ATCC 50983]|uniref:Importin N-terminal domain-containing protein n=1 Tax=Perkinsus marinus (strain ATCC 50983 / TXsc) TaxID=423536 RepID=C5KAS2_PERM5|nr:hypothetical protein Pmar_PMAR005153 [Perkinsus marinus ATCC 50983]EER18248.1 hypothetical protein Pmar_PMAR005153 [Perkinsus marinus ATCC 50983]|eukprot:XP_002786452.1 hypothetical protein Pmar_PMAR005153 [Perkinsus marinus ATCC 50983]
MSGTPAAEVPLSPPNVVTALNASVSSDAVMRGMAIQQLQRWETAPGYALMLLGVYLDASTDTHSKFLAITMCKNTIGRNWQPRSSQCISQEERNQLKQKLVGILYNTDIAKLEQLDQFILLLRRVCRAEFPAKYNFGLGTMSHTRWNNSNTSLHWFSKALFGPVWAQHRGEHIPTTTPTADKEFMAYQKDLKSLLKWFAQIVHTHPLALAECGVDKMLTTFLAPGSGWIHLECMPEFFYQYLINIIQYCVNCTAFRKGISNVTTSQAEDEQMRQKLISILHPQFVNFITNSGGLGSAIVEPVVNAGLCVNRDRLNEWIDEPEQYLTGPPCVATDLRLATEACLLAVQQEPFTQALTEYVAGAANGLVGSIGQLAACSSSSAAAKELSKCDAVVSMLNLYHTILRKVGENETDPNRKYAALIVDQVAVPILQQQPSVANVHLKYRALMVRFQAVLSLRSIFDRDPEHPIWATDGLLSNIIGQAMSMLGSSGGVDVPEADWRLLTAVTSIVNESELSEALQMPLLQTLVNLWRSPDTDELVKFALLDLVKGLLANYYSASTYSVGKELKTYPSLVECSLTMAMDASGLAGQVPYPSSTGSSPTCSPLRVGRTPANAPPPSPANQATVMGALSATQGACSTIGEAGLSLLVSVLRAVRGQEQVARVLPLFPRCLARFSAQSVENSELAEVDIDIITEFVALHLLPEYNPNAVEAVKSNPRGQFSAQGAEALSAHFETIARGIKLHIQHRIDLYSQDPEMNAPKAADDRVADKVFRLVRILLVVDERLVEQIAFPLYQHFLTYFPAPAGQPANGPKSTPLYPFREEPLLMTFATAIAHHPQKFLSLAASGGLESVAVGVQKLIGCYLLPSVSQRCLVLAVPMMLLSAVADGRLVGPEAKALWVSLWNQLDCLVDQVETAQAKAGGPSGVSGLLTSTLRELRSRVPSHAKTPYPYRVSACMIASSLPPDVAYAQDQAMLEWVLKVAVGTVTSFDQRVGNDAGRTLLGFIESDRLTQVVGQVAAAAGPSFPPTTT